MEMALKSYRSTIEVHREGKAYKDMMSKMYYVDGDLKNDTVQFDLAVERFKINNGYIDKRIKDLLDDEGGGEIVGGCQIQSCTEAEMLV